MLECPVQFGSSPEIGVVCGDFPVCDQCDGSPCSSEKVDQDLGAALEYVVEDEGIWAAILSTV